MKELLYRTLLEHRASLDKREYSAVELTRAHLCAIEEKNGELGAFLTVDGEGALVAAAESDRRIARGEGRGMLEGIPYSLKDNIAAQGLPMTCASRILENYVSPYDATVTERGRAAGAVLLGKNNMDEFAMGSTGEHSAFGAVKNPHDPTRVAGGSSSGSAAAVASGMSVFSLGTDTGGSVRQPAAFCGVWGLKPTYGLLSRYGVAAMASSLDCVGILSRSVLDIGVILSVLRGKDPRDVTSLSAGEKSELREITSVRVGVIGGMDGGCVSPDVTLAVERAVTALTALGAHCDAVTLPQPANALAAYTVIAATEAASNLSRYDGVRFGSRQNADSLNALYENSRAVLGDEVCRRILFGIDMLSGENRERYYLRALRVREEIQRSMRSLSERYDIFLSPVAPTAAFKLGTLPSKDERTYADMCTVYASLACLPALSVPMGADQNGLPLAVQLCAGFEKEPMLLFVAGLLTNQRGEGRL
ncbi:MAG: Asp-tRNA(Asn)/Glu-tRNA(Gln) amidotransferase subunit GatA [Ruminococcaceae bacterium]|nr:Asp-tRNA(Asn)/Glu-tRNA(Gln) amidotransferase subunit GatA [Oscillospiraceae bacterium]